MPCYLKSHSYGEYVFDHGWADAYLRAGGNYYPKLQCAVPFTPVTGRRLLVREGRDRTETAALLLQAGVMLSDRLEASSLHITFPTREEWELAGSLGFLQRTDQQFHWPNEGYGSFEEFLSALTSRKRKTIRAERRRALADGIEIEWVTGSDLTEAHWDAFFAFYKDTGSRKWGSPYLTREFFSLIGETMADDILLVLAKRSGRAIAGALNFIGGPGSGCDRRGKAASGSTAAGRSALPAAQHCGRGHPAHRPRHYDGTRAPRADGPRPETAGSSGRRRGCSPIACLRGGQRRRGSTETSSHLTA